MAADTKAPATAPEETKAEFTLVFFKSKTKGGFGVYEGINGDGKTIVYVAQEQFKRMGEPASLGVMYVQPGDMPA